MVSGLWHGANWTFIIWGTLHGIYTVFANVTEHARARIRQAIGLTRIKWLDNGLQRLTTFLLVTIAWIFFRAATVKDAFYMIGRVPSMFGEWLVILKGKMPNVDLPYSGAKFVLCVFVICVMEAVHYLQSKRSINTLVQNQPRYIRWTVYYVFVLAIIYLGVFQNRQFIYFQF